MLEYWSPKPKTRVRVPKNMQKLTKMIFVFTILTGTFGFLALLVIIQDLIKYRNSDKNLDFVPIFVTSLLLTFFITLLTTL